MEQKVQELYKILPKRDMGVKLDWAFQQALDDYFRWHFEQESGDAYLYLETTKDLSPDAVSILQKIPELRLRTVHVAQIPFAELTNLTWLDAPSAKISSEELKKLPQENLDLCDRTNGEFTDITVKENGEYALKGNYRYEKGVLIKETGPAKKILRIMFYVAAAVGAIIALVNLIDHSAVQQSASKAIEMKNDALNGEDK